MSLFYYIPISYPAYHELSVDDVKRPQDDATWSKMMRTWSKEMPPEYSSDYQHQQATVAQHHQQSHSPATQVDQEVVQTALPSSLWQLHKTDENYL